MIPDDFFPDNKETLRQGSNSFYVKPETLGLTEKDRMNQIKKSPREKLTCMPDTRIPTMAGIPLEA